MKSSIKKTVRLVLGKFVFRPYFHLRTSRPVWFFLLNREGRNFYRLHWQKLNSIQERIAADLTKYGIAVTSLQELFPEKDWGPKFRQYADTLRSNGKTREGKAFIKMLWEDHSELSFQNPFLSFTLDEKILQIVNAYFGLAVKFDYYALDITTPVQPGMEAFRSQRWHRDPEDRKMCKVFVYLNDVDEGGGPFIYVPETQIGGRWGHFFPQRPPKGSYPPDGELEKFFSPDKLRVNTGKAGSIIFADTAGLHKGGYATTHERIMFTASYTSKAALRPVQYRLPKDPLFAENVAKLPPISRFALSPVVGVVRFLNKISDFSRKYDVY